MMDVAGPRITFALFAYNQELFIAEAVAGALNQTYAPLEIIISDDSSTDGTFQIIQEMVSSYSGKHRIRLSRNAVNLGLARHINCVMKMVETEWVVVAAGDDISLPTRVQVIVDRIQHSPNRTLSIFSNVIRIDQRGQRGRPYFRIPPSPSHLTAEYFASHKRCIIGASHAWHRSVFEYFGPLDNQIFFEDSVIPFRAALLGHVGYIHEPLVLYRSHDANMFSNTADLTVGSLQHHLQKFIPHHINVARNRLQDLSMMHLKQPELNEWTSQLEETVVRTMHELEIELALPGYAPFRRLLVVLSALAHGTPLDRAMGWMANYVFPHLTVSFGRTYYSMSKNSIGRAILRAYRGIRHLLNTRFRKSSNGRF